MLAVIQSPMDRGDIRRFGATLRHQQSGYEANALVAWAVPEADLKRIGQHLAGQRAVTHCYARRPAPSWPYNLYTMVHGRTPDECVKIAAQMAAETGLSDYEMLFSETELKKTTMRYFKEGERPLTVTGAAGTPGGLGSLPGARQRRNGWLCRGLSPPCTKPQPFPSLRILLPTLWRPAMATSKQSEALFKAACELIPGGVNSPVRAWQSVGLTPRLITRGAGARVFDVDGNSYLDYLGSWGPLILGHAAPSVVAAIAAAAALGTSFGASHARGTGTGPGPLRGGAGACHGAPGQLRHRSLHERPAVGPGRHGPFPGDQVRRLLSRSCRLLPGGRGQRGPHPGHSRQSRGAGGDCRFNRSLPYNDLQAVRQATARHPGEIAAIIVEPVAGNMGVAPPGRAFCRACGRSATPNGHPAHFRRGHHRLPGGLGRGPGVVRR